MFRLPMSSLNTSVSKPPPATESSLQFGHVGIFKARAGGSVRRYQQRPRQARPHILFHAPVRVTDIGANGIRLQRMLKRSRVLRYGSTSSVRDTKLAITVLLRRRAPAGSTETLTQGDQREIIVSTHFHGPLLDGGDDDCQSQEWSRICHPLPPSNARSQMSCRVLSIRTIMASRIGEGTAAAAAAAPFGRGDVRLPPLLPTASADVSSRPVIRGRRVASNHRRQHGGCRFSLWSRLL